MAKIFFLFSVVFLVRGHHTYSKQCSYRSHVYLKAFEKKIYFLERGRDEKNRVDKRNGER